MSRRRRCKAKYAANVKAITSLPKISRGTCRECSYAGCCLCLAAMALNKCLDILRQCVHNHTYIHRPILPGRCACRQTDARDEKQRRLRQQATLNPRPEGVSHPLFQGSEFFDPHDLLQVKYEMLRLVSVEKRPVSEAAKVFGFSRPSFYQAQAAFAQSGLAGLIRAEAGTPQRPQTDPDGNGIPDRGTRCRARRCDSNDWRVWSRRISESGFTRAVSNGSFCAKKNRSDSRGTMASPCAAQ